LGAVTIALMTVILWFGAEQLPAGPVPELLQAEAPQLSERTFTFESQPASEAVALISPQLSDHGSLEIRPGEDIMVIRDTQANLERIVRLLEEFDRPPPPLRLEIRIVTATIGPASRSAESDLPQALTRRLEELLRYDNYHQISLATWDIREGQELDQNLDEWFGVRFRVGEVQPDRRVKLYGFQVTRGSRDREPRVLIHTNLNLWLDKPMILGLARTESSDRALMVILTCTPGIVEARR
jgi:hypothetical protein